MTLVPSLQSQRWRFRLRLLLLLAGVYIASCLPTIDGLVAVLPNTVDSGSGVGGSTTAQVTTPSSNQIIHEFVKSTSDDDTTQSSSLSRFHVHGWRWHTLSLARESGRLASLASGIGDNLNEASRIKDASSYVVDFNMKGLHKIETRLFFPWMREKFATTIKEIEVSAALTQVMDRLEEDQRLVAKLGSEISRNADIACNPKKSDKVRSEAIRVIADQSAQLERTARSMIEVEDCLLVPVIAEIVPEDEQKSFSNKVLRNLGLMDSRLHLVGMYEAVNELDDIIEKDLFETSIPSIPLMMIPRWKRKLYEPRTKDLCR